RDFHVTGVQTCALPISQILLKESLKTLKKDIMTVSSAFIEIFEDWNFALSSSLRYVKEFYSLASIDHLELDSSQLEALGALFKRSEERRVGKECRCRWG